MVDYDIVGEMEKLLEDLKGYKPNDRSEMDRRIAIVITEMEKVYAYFMAFAR